jgi:DNA-binding GntR family transcriptional regulator
VTAPRKSGRRTSATPKISIRERIYRLLRDRMQRGEIGPEDRLVDHEIAASLNVSRMPVREALLQLKSEGFLDSTSRGFTLRRFSPADVAHIFDIRLLLEPAAGAAACKDASIEGLSQMRVATADAERAHLADDIVEYMKANWAFRTAWVAMVPNPLLAQMITRLRDHVEAVRLATLREPKLRELSLVNTGRVLEAFLLGDPDLVRERMAVNLRDAATSFYAKQRSLQRDGAPTDQRSAVQPEGQP